MWSISEEYDIIILVETRLNESISDSELCFENFNVFWMDRSEVNSDCLRGGGVLIAVRNCLFSQAARVTVTCVEQLFVNIKLDRKHILIGAIYMPRSRIFLSTNLTVWLSRR